MKPKNLTKPMPAINLKPWQIKALAEDRAEIRIDGIIGADWLVEDPVTAKAFAADLKTLGAVQNLDIYINSPGGSVFDGSAIYSQLIRHTAHKTVYVEGLAASIASMIAMAGDEVVMPENALMMIHRASGGVWGDANDMRKMADTLEKVESGIVSAYVAKTGREADELNALMAEETWMTAQEAVDLGFADRIAAPVTITACANLDTIQAHYRKRPPGLMDRVHRSTDTPVTSMEDVMPDDPELQNPAPAAESDPQPERDAAPDQPETPVPEPVPDVSALIAAHARIAAECARAGFPQLAARLIADQASPEAVSSRLTQASQIQAACQLAKLPERVDHYLNAGLDVTAVRADLFEALAARDAAQPVATTLEPAPAAAAPTEANLPWDEQCRAQWQRDPTIRAEFSDLDSFLAFTRASQNGQVRIFAK